MYTTMVMYLLLLKFDSIRVLLSLSVFQLFLLSGVAAVVMKIIILSSKYFPKIQMLAFLLLVLLSILYFGLIPFLSLLTVLIGSYSLGKKILNSIPIYNFCVGFFLIFLTYSFLSVSFNPAAAKFISLMISGLIILPLHNSLKDAVISIKNLVETNLTKLSFLEIFFMLFVFAYGSFPQSSFQWDSVYANLYNAKQYVELNAVTPLEESISSFFPQHAILYYSFFYNLGQFEGFQLAYLLPLFIIIFLLKEYEKKIKTGIFFSFFIRLLLFTPIVVAQSSSGYYDLFITSLLLIGIFVLFFSEKLPLYKRLLSTCLLFGIAAASKLFPVAAFLFTLVPLLIKAERKEWFGYTLQLKVFTFVLSVLLLFGPLSFWMIRSQITTGSPIFPLFQNIFPTPELWSDKSSVNDNKMTQTAMSSKQWFSGGIFVYPFLSYLESPDYVESTKGYPGFVYILLVPFQIMLICIATVRMIKKKSNLYDLLLIFSAITMASIGIVSRYYRYLWPNQFLFAFISIIYLQKIFRNVKYSIFLGAFLLVGMYLIHSIDILDSLRFAPKLQYRHLFKPDAQAVNPQDSIWDVLIADKSGKPTLDMSQHALARVYLPGRAYQCNWYWIAGDKKVAEIADKGEESIDQFLGKFSYLIADANPAYKSPYCDVFLQSSRLKLVVKSPTYVLYAIE